MAKIFKNYTERNNKKIKSIIEQVNDLEDKYKALSDEELAHKTEEFRQLLRSGKTIKDFMSDALAVAREAIRRKTGMFAYDVQLEAAIAMYDKTIAQMRTGEGKTLVQILSTYLFALESTSNPDKSLWQSIHIITANEHLVQRDHDDNAPIFELLGFSCGYTEDASRDTSDHKEFLERKKKAYSCDIVYGTAKTIAFDYLSDNIAFVKEEVKIQKGMYHAIVDEADSILLDDAIVPLILSGDKTQEEKDYNELTRRMYIEATKYIHGETSYRKTPLSITIFDQYRKDKSTPFSTDAVLFLDKGRIELHKNIIDEIYSMFDTTNFEEEIKSSMFLSAVEDCLLAEYYYKRGKQYELLQTKKGQYEVVLTDSNTGRSQANTRIKGGLHEAIEIKERRNSKGKYYVKIGETSKSYATTTYPDFLRLYSNGVSGMTGTSDILEFKSLYGMETYIVPPRKKNIREDLSDRVFMTKESKYKAIVEEVKKCRRTLQPVLLGTTSTSESDEICKLLMQAGIRFQRLDAVNSQNESEKIKTAGLAGMVTVATNMAGRGVDIKLGEGVEELGGLYVIGCSRNTSKRVDNQLRGRASRQGQPGKTGFFMSFEDELFKTESNLDISKFGIKADSIGEVFGFSYLFDKCQSIKESKASEQRKENERQYGKGLLKYDKVIYENRRKVLNADNKELINIIISNIISFVNNIYNENDLSAIKDYFADIIDIDSIIDISSKEDLKNNIINEIRKMIKLSFPKDVKQQNIYLSNIKKKMLLSVSNCWAEFIDRLKDVEDSATLSSYAGEDYYKKYEQEVFLLLEEITEKIKFSFIIDAIRPEAIKMAQASSYAKKG